MPDMSEILDDLDKLEETMTTDTDLMARALGLLLLGMDPADDKSKAGAKDPTDLILKSPTGVRTPEF